MSKSYLTESEINVLLQSVDKVFKRTSLRNYLIILMLYRHGLRVSELCNLTWHNIDLKSNRLSLNRLKGSISGYHPMQNDTIKLLKRYSKTKHGSFDYVFCTSQGFPIDRHTVNSMLHRLCKYLGWELIYPHIFRHSCGYHLANQGLDTRLIQDYLGHSDINSTVIYTKTNPNRYKDIKW